MSTALVPTQSLPPAVRLKPIHQLFAEKYLDYFDVGRAAAEAGWAQWHDSEHELERIGRGLLRRADIAAYVEQELTARLRGHGVEKGKVLKEICRISFFDPARLYYENGNPLPINEVDRDTRAAISGIEVEDIQVGSGEERRQIGVVRKYKVINKKDTLEQLAKHLQLFPKDGQEGSTTNNFFAPGSAPQFNVNFVGVKK